MDITKGLDDVLALNDEGAVVTFYQKNGDPYTGLNGQPSTITFVGMESKRVRQALDSNQRRLLRGRRPKLEPEDMRKNRVEVVIAAAIAWSGWDDGKADLPFNAENLRLLLRAEHILEQAEAGIAGHADFFANSSTS